jgi:hypothetical protein
MVAECNDGAIKARDEAGTVHRDRLGVGLLNAGTAGSFGSSYDGWDVNRTILNKSIETARQAAYSAYCDMYDKGVKGDELNRRAVVAGLIASEEFLFGYVDPAVVAWHFNGLHSRGGVMGVKAVRAAGAMTRAAQPELSRMRNAAIAK